MLETNEGKWRDAISVKKLRDGKKKMITVDKKMILIGMRDKPILCYRGIVQTYALAIGLGR